MRLTTQLKAFDLLRQPAAVFTPVLSQLLDLLLVLGPQRNKSLPAFLDFRDKSFTNSSVSRSFQHPGPFFPLHARQRNHESASAPRPRYQKIDRLLLRPNFVRQQKSIAESLESIRATGMFYRMEALAQPLDFALLRPYPILEQ